jgi:glycosyltransferase involved in cell wall biosynthesis
VKEVTVSVIMPTYRRSGVLSGALESIQKQTFTDFDVVVADDHSEDDGQTERVVESLRDGRFRYLGLDHRHGPAGARNAASHLCRGEYLSFLDSDDLWMSQKLEDQLPVLKNDPEVAMVYSDEYTLASEGPNSDIPVRPQRRRPLPSGFIAREFFAESFIGTMTVTLRRSVFEEMGGFDESLMFNEDDDLWFRIMLRHKVVCSAYVSGVRRLHGTNMSVDRDEMTYYQFRTIAKYIGSYPDFIQENLELAKKRLNTIFGSYLVLNAKQHSLPRLKVVKAYLHVRNLLHRLK